MGLPRGRCLLLAVLVALPGLAPARAQEEPSSPDPGPPTASAEEGDEAGRPTVELDRLLRLPDSMEYDVEERGGASADEWRSRFRRARSDVSEAREEVRAARQALEEQTGSESAWTVAPPGLGQVSPGSSEAPANYQLSMALRRAREDLERAERALRALTVEANLAGVPDTWRE